MKNDRMVRMQSSLAWSVVAAASLAAACGGNNQQPASTAAAPTANAAMMGPQPPPAYPATTPPGYPGTAPPPGYPAAQGYPQQPQAYPPAPAAQPGYPPPQQGYPQATPYPAPAPQQPAQGPAPAPAGPLGPTDPNSLQGILQGIQTAIQGSVVPGGAMSGDLTDVGLKAYALHAAPGMQPEGDELKQAMTEGQHSVMMVTLQAGKCYAIVGFSAPGAVKDLDLNLLAPPLYMTLAGQDLTHNNTPVIGGSPSPMCPVIAFPLQYKLDVFAKSGSGQVAVQLYSKTKT